MNNIDNIHKQIRQNLEDYLKSQYFGKSKILLKIANERLDEDNLLWKEPYIESPPLYKSSESGFSKADIPENIKVIFKNLAEDSLGVFKTPFIHQLQALEAFIKGKEIFIATGTGSGKTECFMWPMIAKLFSEATRTPISWNERAVRTVIMYPMNALVADQIGRMRRMLGDSDKKFAKIFKNLCGASSRIPQFGMYTGRTPYSGYKPEKSKDKKLAELYESLISRNDFKDLVKRGKIPAKVNLSTFASNLKKSIHVPDAEDAELITRFEMRSFCPDILITNYSMLEYMLFRKYESGIWDSTAKWLHASPENKLLFIIDEAHMYRGSSGGEVALLIRRFLNRLGINRDKAQFILTTASMPNDRIEIQKFAKDLTAGNEDFIYLEGQRETFGKTRNITIPQDKFNNFNSEIFNSKCETKKLEELNKFWQDIKSKPSFISYKEACEWMYNNLKDFKPFRKLFEICREGATSITEIANEIFENNNKTAVYAMLSIASAAKNSNGVYLYPIRTHMVFKGLAGAFACTNPKCPNGHSDNGIDIGSVFFSDSLLSCPHCGGAIFELFNDRDCGTLFFKGYVSADFESSNNTCLWRYPEYSNNSGMKEIHLFIPPKDWKREQDRKIQQCWMDVKSGFINFVDDSWSGRSGTRKLFYCNNEMDKRKGCLTFISCPVCNRKFGPSNPNSFATKGNEPFFNIIKTQFILQEPAINLAGYEDKYPNQGRKILIFSDSRQKAARLAKDMSEISDNTAARQLFALSIRDMQESNTPLNKLYDYFLIETQKNKAFIFYGSDNDDIRKNAPYAVKKYEKAIAKCKPYNPEYVISESPDQMKKVFLKLLCGGHTSMPNTAALWLEPLELQETIDELKDEGIDSSATEFLEIFNAWIMELLNSCSIGIDISEEIRQEVKKKYGNYGLNDNWDFSNTIKNIAFERKSEKEIAVWRRFFQEKFLSDDHTLKYLNLNRVKACYDPKHKWHICKKCASITPYLLKGKCPSCGNENIEIISKDGINPFDYWNKPLTDAINGGQILVINTEEHTAQLSTKDNSEGWSLAEQYEMRFQDIVEEDKTPVDILSSTTTMEVGIDIGSLTAIGLRNMPPMRENYQQRAGRSGRRGASLSTVVTYCEDNPHDSAYFADPTPMFRGNPRKPWIESKSKSLFFRHIAITVINEFLNHSDSSLDSIQTSDFIENSYESFKIYLDSINLDTEGILFPKKIYFSKDNFTKELIERFDILIEKIKKHPELYIKKSLLDALYEEGIIPNYSFPKNIVSFYVNDEMTLERSLDIALSEYAPGRVIVANKNMYQSGGFYVKGSEIGKNKNGEYKTKIAARQYIEDPYYLKNLKSCSCGWFGIDEGNISFCPFCGKLELYESKMLRPWGFAPKNCEPVKEAQLEESYSSAGIPIYSALPDNDDMKRLERATNIRTALRKGQSIIMLNRGSDNKGFVICKDCGASVPADKEKSLRDCKRPYKNTYANTLCSHSSREYADIGYDFKTDMIVLEFSLGKDKCPVSNPWMMKAGKTLAEAIRKASCKYLDIEFDELVTGSRTRTLKNVFIDIYIYDNLSSGAGYSIKIGENIYDILSETKAILTGCSCQSACSSCLKHFRNRILHGSLDRFYALELLEYGMTGKMPENLNIDEQSEMLKPLKYIIEHTFSSVYSNNGIIKINGKRIEVVPAMLKTPKDSPNVIYINSGLLKYAKQKALEEIKRQL